MKPIQLLIPMSGQGTRYKKAGFDLPKPMIPVSGEPMIARLLRNFPKEWPCTFILADNQRDTDLEILLRELRPLSQVFYIPPHERGPSYAAFEALKGVPSDAPVLLSYCDYGMVWDSAQFEKFVKDTECDACLVSYRGFHPHYRSPAKYAYSRLEGERVVEVREKGSFTEHRESEFASAGAYYFKSASLLRASIESQMLRGLALNGEFYTSLTIEALLQKNPEAHVRIFEIPYFFQWGTPEDLRAFEYWERTYSACNRFVKSIYDESWSVKQIVMPMAGIGSRFQKFSALPKSLIPVGGQPMFLSALSSLPRAEHYKIVALQSMEQQVRAILKDWKHEGVHYAGLSKTPEGQALSVEAGLSGLRAKEEVLVSSCDHAIVLDPKKWYQFKSNANCDAAIFTMQGYVEADSRPQAYAYVLPQNHEEFPNVAAVSVKKPISSRPSRDHVLVGTFWFKNPEILKEGIEELKSLNMRVNGELYLDSIFETLLSRGYKVRIIPLDGYICWGEPDIMREATYWKEVFMGRRDVGF